MIFTMNLHTRETARFAIKTRIADYLADGGGFFGGFDALVRDRGVLPVCYDFRILYFVDPEGDVFRCDLPYESPVLIATDTWSDRMWVYLHGRDQVPELAAFIPERQPGFPDCPLCRGTGKFTVGGRVILDGTVDCLRCGSLGWVLD